MLNLLCELYVNLETNINIEKEGIRRVSSQGHLRELAALVFFYRSEKRKKEEASSAGYHRVKLNVWQSC